MARAQLPLAADDLLTALKTLDLTPEYRRCVHCGRGWRMGLRFRRVNHNACWAAMGFSTKLLSEMGEVYERDDPVPPPR